MKILYFASLKERIGKEHETLSGFHTLKELKQHLEKQYGVFDNNILTAVNLKVIRDDTKILQEEDEIAFYPPVTGG